MVLPSDNVAYFHRKVINDNGKMVQNLLFTFCNNKITEFFCVEFYLPPNRIVKTNLSAWVFEVNYVRKISLAGTKEIFQIIFINLNSLRLAMELVPIRPKPL